MSLPRKGQGASPEGRSLTLASALSFPALLTVPNNTAGIRTFQTQEGRDVFFNDGKILEHNALKIERVCPAFNSEPLLWQPSLLGNAVGGFSPLVRQSNCVT